MGPKKKKGKEDEKKDEMKLIDREFYVIQIEDLNRKIGRLESKCSELESENEEVRNSMEKLDEDRGDVISHLKRVLQRKVDEVSELTERIDALQMSKEKDESLYKEKIKNMEFDFKQMHEQLSSEIKLLNGKLNSLEEFRGQREDLMNKFERQEIALEDQEKRHDQQLLDLEQSYLVRKERLKEEMETRLLKLSLDFQKATQMRIASTTQSVIRENIAVNNQLNILVAEWKKMCEEMDQLKTFNKNLMINEEINRKERRVVERKNIIQSEVIKKLSNQEVALKEGALELNQMKKQLSTAECEVAESRRCERVAIENLGLAKQHIHVLAIRNNDLKSIHNRLQSHCFKLESVLSKATLIVTHLLNLPAAGGDTNYEGIVIKRAELLNSLMEILDWERTKNEIMMKDTISTETLFSGYNYQPRYLGGDTVTSPTRRETLEDDDMLIVRLTQENDFKALLISKLEESVYRAKSLVNDIRLLPKAKTRLLKDDIKEKRDGLIEMLVNILDLSLIQTARPLALPSLETVIMDAGLVEEKFDFPTHEDKMEEYLGSPSKSQCQEDNPE